MAPPSKPAGKPRRLLTAKTTAKAARAMALNATRSPLLRLTPEIRNRIYFFVLGGNDLHLDVDRKGIKHTICMVTPSESIAVKRIDGNSATPSSSIWKDDHIEAGCAWGGEGYARLDSSLLLVSRQTYQEAALLPFTLNTFISQNPNLLAEATKLLLVPHRQALTSLSLWTRVTARPFLESNGISKFERAPMLLLTGLRSVTVHVGVFTLWGMYPLEMIVREVFDNIKQTFERRTLSDATVRVSHIEEAADREEGNVLPGEYQVWALEVEEALKKEWLG